MKSEWDGALWVVDSMLLRKEINPNYSAGSEEERYSRNSFGYEYEVI